MKIRNRRISKSFGKRRHRMIVPAIFSNATPNYIETEELDDLLHKNALVAFRRSNGWVMVGFDDMRDPEGRKGSSWKDRKVVSSQRSLVRILKNRPSRRPALTAL
jgi:hypothetical protein